MEIKLVRIVNILGNFAIVNIDGEKLKAKVEGSIPSYTFLGEIFRDEGKVIIRVRDGFQQFGEIGVIVSQLGLPKSLKGYFLVRMMMSLSLPITKENYEFLDTVKLPPLISGVVLKSVDKRVRKFVPVIESVFESKTNKVTEKDLLLLINSIVVPSERGSFFVFWVDGEKEKWFSYFEFEENGFRKIVLTGKIDEVEVIVVFERRFGGYSVTIDLFSERELRISGDKELRQNLERLGFNPISIDIRLFGVRDEESSGFKVRT